MNHPGRNLVRYRVYVDGEMHARFAYLGDAIAWAKQYSEYRSERTVQVELRTHSTKMTCAEYIGGRLVPHGKGVARVIEARAEEIEQSARKRHLRAALPDERTDP